MQISFKTKIIIAISVVLLLTAGAYFYNNRQSKTNIDILAITPEAACTLEFEIFPTDVPTHLECRNRACTQVTGQGQNTCNTDSDCVYTTCENNSCVEKECTTGNCTDTCTTQKECEPKKHLECRNEACVLVDGEGENKCNSDNNCKKETHTECRNEACVEVDGKGKDECDADKDCKQETHLECVNQACKEVNGSGKNECNTDNDCKVYAPTTTPTPQVPVTGTNYNLMGLIALIIIAGSIIIKGSMKN